MNKGILVVSFGTTHADTREKTIGMIEKDVREEFKDYHIYRAFTSEIVRRRMMETEEISVLDVETAMVQMIEEGITEVIIQPTHVISGIENDKMILQAMKYKNHFQKFFIGEPLLQSREDYIQVTDALLSELKENKLTLQEEQAIVFMGHGSEHKANDSYHQLQDIFRAKGYDNIFISTVEGTPDIYNTINSMKKQEFSTVTLIPFMIVAGEHVKNDMAGEDEDSWEFILTNLGYKVNCVLKGLGENKKIRKILIAHIKNVLL